jgi:hypothetical protein
VQLQFLSFPDHFCLCLCFSFCHLASSD